MYSNGTYRSDDSQAVVLEAHGVGHVFGAGAAAVRAVNGIDLTVRRGEMLLIMGPSGSGKTTLLTILGGLLKPTSGSVCVSGVNVTSVNGSALVRVRRSMVGFVFQSFNLLESLTALENVEVALNLAGTNGRRGRRRAEELLSALGMGHRLHFKPKVLSGGEKQRVSIARALANDPQVILADEPTANLDSEHGAEVVKILREVAKSGRAVVVVSHDHRIQEAADRVLFLSDGRLQAAKTVAGNGSSTLNGPLAPSPDSEAACWFPSGGCSWKCRRRQPRRGHRPSSGAETETSLFRDTSWHVLDNSWS